MLGLVSRRGGLAAALISSGLAVSAPTARAADVSVSASYSANLGGWTIGSGDLTFSMDGSNQFNASLTAGVSGIAALVSSRSASGAASGRVTPGATIPRSYSLTVAGGAVTNTVEIAFSGSSVRSIQATELRFASNNERVPLLPQHKQGVVDPLGGFLIGAPEGRDPLARQTCNRTVRVFDGRVRYDLRMTYGATSEIKDDASGYSGPALICAVAYRPIAGQRILSEEQQRFERNLEFSIWFVPLGNTGVLMPHRVVIGTPAGLLTVSATRFSISGAEPLEAKAQRPARAAKAKAAASAAE